MPRSQKKNSSVALSRGSASKARKSPAKSISKPKTAVKRHPSQPSPPVIGRQWVIIQLSSIGEREKNLFLITRAVHQILRRPLEVFIPAISQKVRGESEVTFFMDGYVFIEFATDIQYLRLQDTTYFSSVLCQTSVMNGRKYQKYSLLNDKNLEPLRRGVQKLRIAAFEIGNTVKIIRGNFKHMCGVVTVVYDDDQNVQVSVFAGSTELRSKKVLMDFPVTYLVKVSSG